ncbi:hypothetical protein PR048_025029 [Dryococelus australis]|uniref:Uncharacterized protein n=1 Tax=Dryococelus australis TaxID=614101 RepID=A0ABQ9GQ60_9NEOP|nr:hypothetical protein PR048_025029 [Dryococelus australis]
MSITGLFFQMSIEAYTVSTVCCLQVKRVAVPQILYSIHLSKHQLDHLEIVKISPCGDTEMMESYLGKSL